MDEYVIEQVVNDRWHYVRFGSGAPISAVRNISALPHEPT
jgi:hypothetical protein